MCTEIKCAVELYNKACQAEYEGMATLAEVYYLKSEVLFEQVGGIHFLNAANSLNALAFLRKSTGDDLGALRALRESLKIIDAHKPECANSDGEFIRLQAWEMMESLVGGKLHAGTGCSS